MSNRVIKRPLTLALGTAFTVTLANIGISHAADNPFAMQRVSGGQTILAEAKCGEGKCGGAKGEEGRCGLYRMDADGDGKVSKEEFMKGHEGMFEHIDSNGDGFIDESERNAHMKEMFGSMKGKCGEGKCGGAK